MLTLGVDAVSQLEHPTKLTKLRSFIGLCNFLFVFCTKLSLRCHPAHYEATEMSIADV